MIWLLRNISVHLWITTLLAIPLSFYLLLALTRYFPGINPLITACASITGIAVIISFLMDLTIRKIVAGLIKEGQAWERSGILNKAKKKYTKALRLYDTFLLWPFSAKKTAWKISGAIAKFNLNSLDFKSPDSVKKNQNFNLSTLVYLKMNPADKDIAQLWLTWLRKSSMVTSFDQEILSILAEKYYDDKIISVLILDVFLGLERKDFTAKKLYQCILKDPELKNRYTSKIEALIGRSDETLEQKVSYVLPGKTPYKKLDRKPDIKLDKQSVKKSAVRIGKTIQVAVETTVFYLKTIWNSFASLLSFLILSFIKLYTLIKESEKIRFYFKAGFLLIISAGLLFFMVNTMSHIFKSKPPEKEKVEIPIKVAKPFTIQVAAYLKIEHAQRYVDILTKKKIDARIKKVDGGGKIWFVVRVSQFTDKQSAAAYGKNLKTKKIIDDFFVSNQ